jgi:hypothetical protein
MAKMDALGKHQLVYFYTEKSLVNVLAEILSRLDPEQTGERGQD